jgi:hypothetical protein
VNFGRTKIWSTITPKREIVEEMPRIYSSPTSAVCGISTCVFTAVKVESSLYMGQFERAGEVQIQVLQ